VTAGTRPRALVLTVAAAALVGTAATVAPAAADAQSAPGTAALAGATPTASGAASETQPSSGGVLSNERTFTTWAHPLEEAGIHQQPSAGSRTIARARLATEDGVPEVYLLLARVTDARGRAWVRVRVPGRPNGRVGWLPREALGEFHVTNWLLEISLSSRRLSAYYKGGLRRTAPVGVGKPSTPTPVGRFWIREIFKLSNRSNPYWPYAIGTSAYSTLTDWPGGGVVGIHGDFGEPQLIPGDPSHGCVRMHAGDMSWLAARVQLGTPVHIVP
jgi:hypothetical protein